MALRGRDTWLSLLLSILYIVHLCEAENQRFDGWYNNLDNPSWGAVGDDIIFDVPPAYSDMTYQPSGQDRPNARLISNAVLSGPSGLASYKNRTTMFAFFSQMVAYELVHAADSGCPIELMKVPVPKNDPEFDTNQTSPQYMPVLRSLYNAKTGHSPNNPRRPINKVSAWIDGNFVYGGDRVWCNCLRSFTGGRLLAINETKNFPARNKIGLALENFPSPVTQKVANPEELWMFGDAHVHQNPGLASIAIIWFRYHNYLANVLQKQHPDWKDQKIFHTARRKVIATLQNIIVYEWLPNLLDVEIPLYTGYRSHVQPGITALFEAAALRMGHSFIPPGFYIRDRHCNFKPTKHGRGIRLCNSYWHSQEIVDHYSLEHIVLGMTSQLCEREDHVIVNDLRGNTFGPLHFSRHDLSVMTVMRGRDHGLPDYNTARKALGLRKVDRWEDINPWLYKNDPQVIRRLREIYNGSLDKLDIYPAGLLESTPAGPGPLFTKVLLDQFVRLRDSDRFWFENIDNGIFTKNDVKEIKRTTFRDVILATTGIVPKDLQDDVFTWRDGNPCPQPHQLREDDMEPCTPHRGYDYFSGSEISYITAFTSFGLVPFVCILVAVIIAKCKNVTSRKGTLGLELGKAGKQRADNYTAVEWVGPNQTPRSVELSLAQDACRLNLLCQRKRCLRTVDFERHLTVNIWTSSDKAQDVLMINIPREYDLMLRFACTGDRTDFLNALREMLKASHKTPHLYDNTTKYLQKKCITKEKREELLTRFFRSVFAKARAMDVIRSPDEIEISQCKEIVDCELSRAEFAEALALSPNSLFVDQMFTMIDRDGNGYISFRELLYAVLLFAKGSCEDKLQLIFHIYDRDRSGSLSRLEVSDMIKSMMEMANTSLCSDEVTKLVNEMFETAGLEMRSSLKFKDFQRVLSGQMHMFWDVCLDWKGTKICFPKEKMARKTDQNRRETQAANFDDAAEKETHTTTKLSEKMKNIRHYIENHTHHILYLFIFYSMTAVLFTERFYFFAMEQEHTGFRSLAGYGVSVTRGAAAAMSFTFSLLLLTMCRNVITKLRETVVNLYVPFDSHVAFHKIVAYTALFFTAMHVLGYCFNFYHIATQPVSFLCVFDEINFRPASLPKFHFWLFENLTGMTGVLLVVVICIIYIFATQTARRHIFNAFWITHRLFYALYILTLLHGCSRLIQQPYFPFYFIGPAILFLADKMVSLSRKQREVGVIRADLLPSDVTMLEFKRPADFEYRSGQWVRLACDALGKDEYHALTLTSAPHEEMLSVHIRGIGPWTKNIRKVFDPDCIQDQPYPKLYIDGPFGAGQQDWFRYDVSVLVGGGIGVTPYASILKDFVFMTSVKNTFRLRCHKVYFIWVTASQKHFEWLIDILRQQEDVDKKGVVETHIFITQLFHNFDLRTTMLYICEEHFQRMSGRSMFTGLKAKTHFGRPNFNKVLQAVHAKHPKVKKVGVFSCGPPGLTTGVQKACYDSSKTCKVPYEHHFENF